VKYWGYQLAVVVVVDRMVLFVQEGFEVLQAVLALAEYAMVVCEETSVDLIRSPMSCVLLTMVLQCCTTLHSPAGL